MSRLLASQRPRYKKVVRIATGRGMDKFLRLALTVGALLAGAGVFYHFVVSLPEIERQKQAQIKADKLETGAKEAAKQRAYEICQESAKSDYAANWATACETVAMERGTQLRNCLVDPAVMKNEFLGEKYCKRTYGSVDPSINCSLPGARATAINGYFKEAKEKCLAEAKSGL